MARPYQKANIPGPEMGTSVYDPEVMANLLKSPKKKVFVIGSESLSDNFTLDGKKVVDYYVEIAKKLDCHVIATGHAYKYLKEKISKEKLWDMSLINITGRLVDKYNKKMLLLIAVIFYTIGILLFLSASDFLGAILAQIPFSVGNAMIFNAEFAMLAAYSSSRDRSTAYSIQIFSSQTEDILVKFEDPATNFEKYYPIYEAGQKKNRRDKHHHCIRP